MADHLCGVYRGRCYDNVDPESRSRIRVTIPSLLGGEPTNWALPCRPVTTNLSSTGTGGDGHTHPVLDSTAVPLIGQGVWVMFEGGTRENPVWLGVY